MKRRNGVSILACLFITGVLFFSACKSVSPPHVSENVSVSLSAVRSAANPMSSVLDFDFYEFTFKNIGIETMYTSEKRIEASFSFIVPEGSDYALNVKAYKGTGEDKILVAEGDFVSFSVDSDTSVEVPLSFVDDLKVSPDNITLYSRAVNQLTAAAPVSGGSLVWSSSDASIVDVTQEGLVKAGNVTKNETATITVSNSIGNSAAVQVTVKPSDKWIALSFDDGPDVNPAATPKLLDVLNEKEVHVSFFMMGRRVEYNDETKELVRRMHREGHDISSHSYTHPWRAPTVEANKKELMDTQEAIYNATGEAPVFFRPPFLDNNDKLKEAAAELGLPCIHGELLDDWSRGKTPEFILSRAKQYAKNWGILIFHDYLNDPAYPEPPTPDDYGGNGDNTVKAIPVIIDSLRNEGYEIVSVSEMLARKKVLYLKAGQSYQDFLRESADPAFPADGVIIGVESIAVSDESITLNAGTTTTVTARVFPNDATYNAVYWYSSDNDVATIDANGEISAIAAGETTIVARAEGKIAKITVTVN